MFEGENDRPVGVERRTYGHGQARRVERRSRDMGQIALAVEDQRPAGVDDGHAVDILADLGNGGRRRSHALHPQPVLGKPGPAEDFAELGVEAINEGLNCRGVPRRSEA